MDLLVLCGGRGTRLASISNGKQKCSMPINGISFVEHLLKNLSKQFIFDKILFCVGHSSKDIVSLNLDPMVFNANEVHYIHEKIALGTGGAIKNALSLHNLSDVIMICNGDSICDINNLAEIYYNNGLLENKGIIASAIPEKNNRYGSIIVDSDNHIISFKEKGEEKESKLINAGVYIFKKTILEESFDKESEACFSLELAILPLLVKEYSILLAPPTRDFIDIGIPDDFYKATSLLSRNNTNN